MTNVEQARATSPSGMGWHLEQPIASGQLILEQVDPAELSPGELTGMVRRRVEADNVGMACWTAVHALADA